MGDSNVDRDGGGVNGDGSGGNFPSQQSAGTETSVPRTSSTMAVVLRNFIWENADLFRVFASEAFYRRMGDVRRHPGAPHHRVARPGVHPRHQVVWPPPGPPSSLIWTPSRVGENRNFGLCFVQIREYFLCNFSERQK
jgi:hypothetical protein